MNDEINGRTFVRAPHARARGATVIPREVTKRINRVAHSQALQYEQTVRKEVTWKLQALASMGANLTELVAEMERILSPGGDDRGTPER